jgi:hypothetical protein
MIDSYCARAEGDVFERIAAQVAPEGRRRIDELLAVPEGDLSKASTLIVCRNGVTQSAVKLRG